MALQISLQLCYFLNMYLFDNSANKMKKKLKTKTFTRYIYLMFHIIWQLATSHMISLVSAVILNWMNSCSTHGAADVLCKENWPRQGPRKGPRNTLCVTQGCRCCIRHWALGQHNFDEMDEENEESELNITHKRLLQLCTRHKTSVKGRCKSGYWKGRKERIKCFLS